MFTWKKQNAPQCFSLVYVLEIDEYARIRLLHKTQPPFHRNVLVDAHNAISRGDVLIVVTLETLERGGDMPIPSSINASLRRKLVISITGQRKNPGGNATVLLAELWWFTQLKTQRSY